MLRILSVCIIILVAKCNIDWPFTNCYDGPVLFKKLTLQDRIIRNKNNSITAVI